MKVKDLLEIQKIVEDREIPYDVKDFDSVYFSKSKGYNVKILDLINSNFFINNPFLLSY